ncbi:MAG: hypothetical protein AUJ85_10500 [Elusimicrobia bacterium CG1_02_37_114]|nr:MAG: hypothetical protein AUJ85_10500 [Elusimicrobia bacterium CG1_02_37_114]PIZ12425.1 MAG: hypothetical protein COY53_10080 [Elusimicrobia bacterium CG_4_10_14_0_8_um_filter_37_32]
MDFFVLGLKDVKIISYEQNYGRLEIVLEKTTSCETCPSCQARSKSVKNYREHRIILNPIESIQVQAFIRKRCFRCLNPSCQTKYFTEQIPGLEKKHIYTEQFKSFLADLYQDMDFPTIKRRLSKKYLLDVPIGTLHSKLKDLPKESLLVKYPIQTKYIGLDEFSYTKGHNYAVALIKIGHSQDPKSKIIDMVAGGKTTAVAKAVLNSVDPISVEACCMDFWEPFKTAVKEKLPNASVVADKYHTIKLINDDIQTLIRRILPALSQYDKELLEENKFLILKGRERLDDNQSYDLQTTILINNELETIYVFKEQFRSLYLIKNIDIAR